MAAVTWLAWCPTRWRGTGNEQPDPVGPRGGGLAAAPHELLGAAGGQADAVASPPAGKPRPCRRARAPPLPLDAAVWASTGSATDRRPHVVRAPIQWVAGLVPNTSASASAERRCKNDGDDDHCDDSGAGDEQSAIHGYLLRFVRWWSPSPTTDACGPPILPGDLMPSAQPREGSGRPRVAASHRAGASGRGGCATRSGRGA
jgi:hypothetical protein